MTKPEKLIVPKDLGDWLDTRDIGNESLMFTLIDELKEQLRNEFLGKTREFVFDYKKEVIEVLIGNRDYEVEEPEVYALVKGHEVTPLCYWNLTVRSGELFVSDLKEHGGMYKIKMTKQEWNELGINETNADFRSVQG